MPLSSACDAPLHAGRPCLKEASTSEPVASATAERGCSDAIRSNDGYGYVADFPVERIRRAVQVCRIYDGAGDIRRRVIGRAHAGARTNAPWGIEAVESTWH